jgi:mannose-6-phosphate isomerase-like protein (cupin superfamily)
MNRARKLPVLSPVFLLLFISQFTIAQLPEGVLKFSFAELKESGEKVKGPWNEFLNNETIQAGIYTLHTDEKDEQTPHRYDEIYYVLEGEGTLHSGGKEVHAKAGSVIFVRAQVAHFFHDIKSPLTVLVLFSKGESSEKDPSEMQFTLADVERKRKPIENVWNPFIQVSTMTFGLYMLPKKLHGDSTLTHRWDELNIVTRGSGKFTIDGFTMNVSTGDIIYVRKQKGHYFHDLKKDFDVLILFEKKSIAK